MIIYNTSKNELVNTMRLVKCYLHFVIAGKLVDSIYKLIQILELKFITNSKLIRHIHLGTIQIAQLFVRRKFKL